MRIKILIISLLIGIILTVGTAFYSARVQDDIAQNILRLHVLANSDDPADQALKLRVRDRILSESGKLFAGSGSLQDTRRILNENIGRLAMAAQSEVAAAGFDYDVNIETGKYPFPTRYYENIALPAGEYEAVRVMIGDAKGQNWWCVMFPPLCFVDAAMGKSSEDSLKLLKDKLTDSEYSVITSDNGAQGVNIRFKVVDFFQESMENVKTAFK